jgi:ribose 5-phosphate isomerase B
VAAVVSEGVGASGVLVCGTGIGMAIAANKLPGVRAAVCGDVEAARLSREHNDANVLALGARVTGPETAVAVVQTWLETDFLGGRHARRVEKVSEIERSRTGGREAHAPAR